MKKIFIKTLIIFLCAFSIAAKGLCAEFDFSHSFISDNSNFLDNFTKEQLNDVLKNLHKETNSYLILLTLNSLGENETFATVENDILSKYAISGTNDDRWVIVIFTRNPRRMNIRVGDGLKKIIPNSMKRAIGIEFWLNQIIYGNGTNFISRNGVQSNLYTTVLILAEAIADDKGARLHTSDEVIDIFGMQYRERGVYIPRTTDTMKFIRRHNLYPILIILAIGIFPFMLRRRRNFLFRRRRRKIDV